MELRAGRRTASRDLEAHGRAWLCERGWRTAIGLLGPCTRPGLAAAHCGEAWRRRAPRWNADSAQRAEKTTLLAVGTPAIVRSTDR
ncbi:hypothetical protein E5D57_003100 [Metarhizium anisopliae]|nr:hypothetical protein E5D57_003100 [Metarhizium anisopliae]